MSNVCVCVCAAGVGEHGTACCCRGKNRVRVKREGSRNLQTSCTLCSDSGGWNLIWRRHSLPLSHFSFFFFPPAFQTAAFTQFLRKIYLPAGCLLYNISFLVPHCTCGKWVVPPLILFTAPSLEPANKNTLAVSRSEEVNHRDATLACV